MADLSWAKSALDPPSCTVVGIIWHPGGTFETVLACPVGSVSAAIKAHGRRLWAQEA